MKFLELIRANGSAAGLSKEQLAGFILEALNSEPALASGERAMHERNFLRGLSEAAGDDDLVARASSAWRWLVNQDYLVTDVKSMDAGWYKVATKGRSIRQHQDLVTPRVPREVNPGLAPWFLTLTDDPALTKHLHVLWEEAVLATNGNAHLAAVIMLGSLLEGSLLAKALSNQVEAANATSAPKGRGGVKPLERWYLSDFIQVANECQWIHKSRAEFSDVLRGYRNLVHPLRAYNNDVFVDRGVVAICWQIVIATLGDLGVASPT